MKPKSKNAQSAKANGKSLSYYLENRWVQLVLIAILSITYLVNFSAIFDNKLDQNGDNIHYFTLGKAIADGKGLTNIMGFEETPHTHFPPGYPVFVASVLKISPDNIHAVKVANGILMWLAIVLLYVLIKRVSKNTVVAFFSCWLCCFHTRLLRWATIMMSEPLYIVITLLAMLVALELYRRTWKPEKRWLTIVLAVVLGALLSYAYLVRTIGMAIVLAVLAWMFLLGIGNLWTWLKRRNSDSEQVSEIRGRWLRCGLAVLVAGLMFFATQQAWKIRDQHAGKAKGSYTANFNKRADGGEMTTTADWVERIESNAGNFITRWIPNSLFYTQYNLNDKITGKEWFRGIVILLLMGLAILRMKEGKGLVLMYVAITMGVLLVYPEQFGGDRYYIPLMGLFFFLIINGAAGVLAMLYKLVSKNGNPLVLQLVVIGVGVLFFMTPMYAKAQKDDRKLAKIKTWQRYPESPYLNYLQASNFCGRELPKEARILCRKPEVFYMHSNFHKASGIPQEGSPEEVLKFLKEKEADYIIIDAWFGHAYRLIYPTMVKYPQMFRQIATFGNYRPEYQLYPTLVVQFVPTAEE